LREKTNVPFMWLFGFFLLVFLGML
jgi:hypothetical protein